MWLDLHAISVLSCSFLPYFFFYFLVCVQANNLGVGVVGVIECDFLQPTHNKQDFDYTKMYRYVTPTAVCLPCSVPALLVKVVLI